MAHEIHQTASGHTALIDDRTGNRSLHLQPDARVFTTAYGVITETSPGVITGLGGDPVMKLPGGAIPTALRYWGAKNSNTTTGTISVGIDTTAAYFLSAQNVADLPTGQGVQQPRAVLNLFTALALVPVGSAHLITGAYAESATSTFGGPWYVAIDYYLPIPA